MFLPDSAVKPFRTDSPPKLECKLLVGGERFVLVWTYLDNRCEVKGYFERSCWPGEHDRAERVAHEVRAARETAVRGEQVVDRRD